MARIPQGIKDRGSQHWLQILANQRPDVFERAIDSAEFGKVHWLSPMESDEYAEYRDEDFQRLLGLELKLRSLRSFWPPRGLVWDGLARSESGAVLLVEAKANLPEFESSASQASPASAKLIAESMNEAKPSFGAPTSSNWMGAYCQYANRLSHLYLLRAENAIDAFLVFLYFTGGTEVGGPLTTDEWTDAIHSAHQALQIREGPLSPFVLELFIDITNLAAG